MAGFDDVKMGKVFLYVAIALVTGFLIGIIVGNLKPLTKCNAPNAEENASIAAPVACPKFECSQVMRNASYELLGNESSGTGSIFGGNAKISVPVKNLDAEGAFFQVTINCQTLNRDASEISSDRVYIGPNQTGGFPLEYVIDARENWKCNNYRVIAEAVRACEMSEIQ